VVGGGFTVLAAPAALAAAGFGVGIAKGSAAAAFMASYGQSIVCPSPSFCLFLSSLIGSILSMNMTLNRWCSTRRQFMCSITVSRCSRFNYCNECCCWRRWCCYIGCWCCDCQIYYCWHSIVCIFIVMYFPVCTTFPTFFQPTQCVFSRLSFSANCSSSGTYFLVCCRE
jgi:hypothetical protein